MNFSIYDAIIVVLYLVAIAAFGIIRGGKQRSAQDYFLGKETIPWWIVCFSIVAAETSTLTFISIPGLAYLTNLTFLQLAIGYLLGRIIVSVLFLPAYYKGELSTAYAFLERRFGGKTRKLASVVFLFTRLAADGVRLFATAIPLKLILNIDYPIAISILAGVAFIYTFAGGVRGVVWVDAIQMFIYISGAIVAAVAIAFSVEGGIAGIVQIISESGKLHFIDVVFGYEMFERPYNLIAGILGGAFLSMASHGTDQLIVQRVLTTKSLKGSQKALIGSGIIIIFQFAIFLIVGLFLFAHYGGQSIAELGLRRADEIFPYFIIQGLPIGVSGIIIAGLMAAALSTLAGSMSSIASSAMLDLYKPIFGSLRSTYSDLTISRIITFVAALVLVGSAVFFMSTDQTIVELALSIASFTYGGLLGTFLLGVLFTKPNQQHALIAFISGILIMVFVISLKLVAWTWFTVVGVIATVLVGNILSTISGMLAKKVESSS